MTTKLVLRSFAVLMALASAALPVRSEPAIIVQSTTSTANSGLYDHLLPAFEKGSGITVRVVAVGTGQAIKNARNCDGDVLLVHAKSAEERFVAEGFGVRRFDLMYNDFVLVGPKFDPAAIIGKTSISEALVQISRAAVPFASRGDDSGTHKKEQALWKGADVDVEAWSGKWYRSTGSGMGATLNIATGMGAYTLTDRATWTSFKNKGDFVVAVEGDENLFNQYGVILVNKEKCPDVKSAEGQAFVDWLLSSEGQELIGSYRIGAQQLFFPNAK